MSNPEISSSSEFTEACEQSAQILEGIHGLCHRINAIEVLSGQKIKEDALDAAMYGDLGNISENTAIFEKRLQEKNQEAIEAQRALAEERSEKIVTWKENLVKILQLWREGKASRDTLKEFMMDARLRVNNMMSASPMMIFELSIDDCWMEATHPVKIEEEPVSFGKAFARAAMSGISETTEG